jgi:hypothetical protein
MEMEPLQRVLFSLKSGAMNSDNSDDSPVDWDTLNNQLIRSGAPSLGANPRRSYDSFKLRWDDPQEGPLLKKYIDRFDGQGIVLKTGEYSDRPEQGEPKKTSMMATAAKRATKAGDLA